MRWLILLTIAVIGFLGLLWVFQRRLIYLPEQAVADHTQALPGSEEVDLVTGDGLTLTAWFLPAPEQRATVAVFNGNAGNRSHRAALAAALARRGYSVLLVDYRGFGGNPGSPTEEGLLGDARAAVDYLDSRRDVDAGRVVYFGESLGAGVAIALAGERPPAALVLRSPFTSLVDIASVHYPFLPVSLLLWDRYPNSRRVEGLDSALLVIAGSEDRIVPMEQSRALYDAAGEPKDLVVIDGAGHNDFALLAGDEMVDAIVGFLDDALGVTRQS